MVDFSVAEWKHAFSLWVFSIHFIMSSQNENIIFLNTILHYVCGWSSVAEGHFPLYFHLEEVAAVS